MTDNPRILTDISLKEVLALSEAIPEKQHFRYFEKDRSKDFENHYYHCILAKDTPLGYGHLSQDFWIGLFIVPGQHSKGYGKFLLRHLIEVAKHDVYLVVDKKNTVALNLYFSENFEIYDDTPETYYCRRLYV